MSSEFFDVIIIGGGPAGISAAVWCADLGLSSVVLEREEKLYGQLRWIHNPIANYLGLSAADGEELIASFEQTARKWNLRTETAVKIEAVDCAAGTVTLANDRAIRSKALIIATGVRRGTLGISGEVEFVGKGILRSGSAEREKAKGKRVVVVGGGDAAAENALILAENADRVLLIHRRAELTARPEFIAKVGNHPRIETLLEAKVTEIGGEGRVGHIEVESLRDGTRTRIDTDHFIARIGVAPNTELFKSQLATDPKGYIIVDAQSRTTSELAFAIGDVANPISPTIATATGTAATAAKALHALLTSNKTV